MTNNKKKSRKKAAARKAAAVTASRNHESEEHRSSDSPDSVSHGTETVPSTSTYWKLQGNKDFQKNQFEEAISCYRKALEILQADTPLDQASTNGNASNSNCTADNNRGLQIDLHNNISMTCIKLQNYSQAEAECTYVLENLSQANSKVWYRRGVARQGQADVNGIASQSRRAFLEGSMSDLNESWRLLQLAGAGDKEGHQKMQQSVQRATQRVQHSLEQISPPISNGKSTSQAFQRQRESLLSELMVKPVVADQLSKKAQKETILKLLIGRQVTLAKHPQTDEALFVIDWDWWIDWALFVDFFRSAQVIQHMPTGAVVPDDEEWSSTDSEPPTAPGPIDNTSLVFINPEELDSTNVSTTSAYFVKTWYRSYLCQSSNPNAPATHESTFIPLKPNLVRGYHYELIPREVYNALRAWYGEVSHSICRRTSSLDCVDLYPTTGSNDQTVTPGSSCCHACRVSNAKLRCKRCMVVYYCQRSCQESHWSFHRTDCKRLEKIADVGSRTLGPLPLGRVGLSNLGNTCFMNSALQCLSHATPLTRHFLSNLFLRDVNEENPLGTGGKLAQAYATVLKELWMRDINSTSPTGLKRAIATFAPRFAGSLQHDAQEFLAYLLDGLHEDLNRVRSKPYVELPDVGAEHSMDVAGARVWDATSRRDDSLVMDTFYGQFKSTCVCPHCDKVSVSFDAFNHISLELPQADDIVASLAILVMPSERRNSNGDMLRQDRLPVRHAITMKRSASVMTLKIELARRLGDQDPQRLVICESRGNRILNYRQNSDRIGDVIASKPSLLIACDVDPIEGVEPLFHAVCTHATITDDVSDNRTLDLFGIPFLASFPADITCHRLWEKVWEIVGHLVAVGETEEPTEQDKGLLQIHLYANERPHLVFPVPILNVGENEQLGDIAGLASDDISSTVAANGEMGLSEVCTSQVPHHSSERLVDILGPKAHLNFLMIRLVWQNSGSVENESQISSTDKPLNIVDMRRFEAIRNDKSWEDYVRAPPKRGVTLDECLDTFTRPERLDKNNQWYCSRCREHVRAMKTMELWRLPNVLIVHLKRFEFKSSLRREKLETLVNFPIDGLDMDHYSRKENHGKSSNESEQIPAVYDLFAVTNHYGRMGFGHYTAFARYWDEHGIDDEWTLFDDSRARALNVTEVNDAVISPAAYILYYRRRQFR